MIELDSVLNGSPFRHAAGTIINGKVFVFINQNREHAEFRLLREIKRLNLSVREVRRLTIYIVRGKIHPKTHENVFVYSRPCKMCMKNLIKAGITKISYTDNNGKFVLERIDE